MARTTAVAGTKTCHGKSRSGQLEQRPGPGVFEARLRMAEPDLAHRRHGTQAIHVPVGTPVARDVAHHPGGYATGPKALPA